MAEKRITSPSEERPSPQSEQAANTSEEAPAERMARDTERLREWREDRLRQAEAARQERLEQFSAEQQQRIAEAKSRREAELAAEAEALREQARKKLPSAAALQELRQEIAERRKARHRAAIRSLLLFVGVPTLLAAFYIYVIATPLYEARSVFTVQTSAEKDSNDIAGIIGTMVLSDSVRDTFMLRDFILSRRMMDHLETQEHYLDGFRTTRMDPLGRLYTSEFMQLDEYWYFRRRVHATVDMQQGLLRLYVQAMTPDAAHRVSEAILSYAEAHLNAVSSRIVNQEIELLGESVAAAEERLKQAHRNVIELQVQRNLSDMQIRGAGSEERERITDMYETIRELEARRLELKRELIARSAASTPDQARNDRLNAAIDEIDGEIAEIRTRLVDQEGGGILNRRRSDIDFAQLEREIAQRAWESALVSLERSRVAALERRRYIVVVVPPENPSIATVPNKLKSFVAVFLGLFGGYVLVALLRASLRLRGRL